MVSLGMLAIYSTVYTVLVLYPSIRSHFILLSRTSNLDTTKNDQSISISSSSSSLLSNSRRQTSSADDDNDNDDTLQYYDNDHANAVDNNNITKSHHYHYHHHQEKDPAASTRARTTTASSSTASSSSSLSLDDDHEQRIRNEFRWMALQRAQQQQQQQRQHHVYPIPPKRMNRTTVVTSDGWFPDINVVGFPKSGTSHLYHVIATHPHVTPYAAGKEVCNLRPSSTMARKIVKLKKHHQQQQQQQYSSSLDRHINNRTKSSSSSLSSLLLLSSPPTNMITTVNGCLREDKLFAAIQQLQSPSSKKYILVFRDPADRLWSSYNFWYNSEMDTSVPLQYDWTSSTIHYRSPELFHELIVSSGKLRASQFLYTQRNQSIAFPRTLIHRVGRDNVLMIRNEDMLPDAVIPMNHQNNTNNSFLDQLSTFTGLDRMLFQHNETQVIRNCNDSKGNGIKNVCNTTKPTNHYDIAHGRPMMEQTRQLIYMMFWEECKIWSQEFNIHYPACLNVLASNDQS
jgi:hypothetical protein